MPDARPAAVVLLSGGLDSTTCLALATREGFAVHALSVRYGQRHAHEVEAARRIAARYGVARHVVVDIDLRVFGGSALTTDLAVPKDRPLDTPGDDHADIPITYVPARNTIFLSLALGWAEAAGARDMFIGVNALDYSGYPDCRPVFVEQYERLANLATKAGVEGQGFTIHTPLLHMSKAAIAGEADRLGLDAALSWSCYDPAPEGVHCGLCDSCRLRSKGYEEAGLPDPTHYAARP